MVRRRSGRSSRRERQAMKRRQRTQVRLAQIAAREGASRLHLRSPRGPGRAGWWAVVVFGVSLCAGIGMFFAKPLGHRAFEAWQQRVPRVEHLAIGGLSRLHKEEIALQSGLERSTPLASADPARIAQQLRALDWVETAVVVILPSGTALIDIQERQPRALLHTPDAAKAATPRLIDARGVAFAAAEPEDLSDPGLAHFEGPEALATTFGAGRLRQALELDAALRALQRSLLKGARIRIPALEGIAPEEWHLTTADGRIAIQFGEFDAIAPQLRKLERLIDADLLLPPGRGEVDLRFEGQAVLRGLKPLDQGTHDVSREETRPTWRRSADAPSRPTRGVPGDPVHLGGGIAWQGTS